MSDTTGPPGESPQEMRPTRVDRIGRFSRVTTLSVFAEIILPDWISHAEGILEGDLFPFPAPILSRLDVDTFVTDEDSLKGYEDAISLAVRVELNLIDQAECAAHGAAVFTFNRAPQMVVRSTPSSRSEGQSGNTSGGAREFLISPPVRLTNQMAVALYFPRNAGGVEFKWPTTADEIAAAKTLYRVYLPSLFQGMLE